MNTLAHVINKALLIIVVMLGFNCSTPNSNELFWDTFDSVLSGSVRDFRYNRPPNFEEFQKGIEIPYYNKRPDSLDKLRVTVAENPIEVDFNQYSDKFPEEYKFVINKNSHSMNYIPPKIQDYTHKDYKVEFQKNPHKNFKGFQGMGYGGMLQLSNAIINQDNDKAIVYLQLTRSRLDGFSSIVLFKKIKGKWEIEGYIPIAIS
jgi:hypothetical protein